MKACEALYRSAPDAAFVGLDDGAGDGKAEACIARASLAPGGIDPVKAVEELLQVLWSDCAAWVFDA